MQRLLRNPCWITLHIEIPLQRLLRNPCYIPLHIDIPLQQPLCGYCWILLYIDIPETIIFQKKSEQNIRFCSDLIQFSPDSNLGCMKHGYIYKQTLGKWASLTTCSARITNVDSCYGWNKRNRRFRCESGSALDIAMLHAFMVAATEYQCVVVCSKDCRAIVATESPIPFFS